MPKVTIDSIDELDDLLDNDELKGGVKKIGKKKKRFDDGTITKHNQKKINKFVRPEEDRLED